MWMIIRWQISTLSSKHPERDGVNGQARNVLLAEHISLIIDENTVEAKFRVTVSTRHSGTDLVTLVIHQKKQCFVLKEQYGSAVLLRRWVGSRGVGLLPGSPQPKWRHTWHPGNVRLQPWLQGLMGKGSADLPSSLVIFFCRSWIEARKYHKEIKLFIFHEKNYCTIIK